MIKPVKWLVCGSRRMRDEDYVWDILDSVVAARGKPFIVIVGGAPGVDTIAGEWARARDIHTAEVVALWQTRDKTAGPTRNMAMAALEPALVIAFPMDGPGTRNMISIARKRGIELIEVKPK